MGNESAVHPEQARPYEGAGIWRGPVPRAPRHGGERGGVCDRGGGHGGGHGEDHGAPAVLAAAEVVMRSAPETAVCWLRAALSALPPEHRDGPRHVSLLEPLSRALALAGRLEESRDLLREITRPALRLPGAVRTSAVARYARVECGLGNYGAARALLGAELARLGDAPSRGTAAFVVGHGIASVLDGRPPEHPAPERARWPARRNGDPVTEAGALALAGLCETLTGRIEAARDTLTASAAIMEGLTEAEPAPHAEYLAVLGWGEILAGRFPEAERHLRRGLRVVGGDEFSYAEPVLLVALSHLGLRAGTVAEAGRLTSEARRLAGRRVVERIAALASRSW
ncbi:hypothetical protein [Streptosporangium sp. NPDC051022]|uniref:hypothetical protein n=1 Tax=Streptosporangium sp. NPDC051022 TaxID=3155752 RepID=UPI00341BA455